MLVMPLRPISSKHVLRSGKSSSVSPQLARDLNCDATKREMLIVDEAVVDVYVAYSRSWEYRTLRTLAFAREGIQMLLEIQTRRMPLSSNPRYPSTLHRSESQYVFLVRTAPARRTYLKLQHSLCSKNSPT